MPKKKNAFSFFIDHYWEQERRKGRDLSKKEAASECGSIWDNLPQEKRHIFCDLAKACKNESYVMNPTQQWQDPVTGELGEEWLKYTRSGEEVAYLNCHIRNEQTLRRFNFYIVHCNYFCKLSCTEYLPAEIALLEFNLEEGIKRTYHTLIDPGSVPLGFAYEVKRISESVHGIPSPPYDKGEKDKGRIAEAIRNFMEPSREQDGKYSPMFTIESNALPAMHILHDLVQSFSVTPAYVVYPIHRLFFWIKNKCTEYCGYGTGFPVLTNAITEIEKDAFRFIEGISCNFHSQSAEKYHNCSLSIIQRLVYLICDHCCRHVKIQLVGGKHIHKNFAKRLQHSQNDQVIIKSYPDMMLDVASNYAEDLPECSGVSTYASSVCDIDSVVLDDCSNISRKQVCNSSTYYDDEDFGSEDYPESSRSDGSEIRGRGRGAILEKHEKSIGCRH